MDKTIKQRQGGDSLGSTAGDKYVIPPGIGHLVDKFDVLFDVVLTRKTPVLICGATGVGKSLFLNRYKERYLEKYPKSKNMVFTVNCSHFEGDTARSELFGHVKGAFTGADSNKKGWLETANGGVLMLEEIGDLPPPAQAQLLTFLETGEFHRLGDNSIVKSDVQVVAATNRENQLRDDLRYRFHHFDVGPLYTRRIDVLFYLNAKFPDLIPRLKPWEVLTLLAHNWAGNVRDIEMMGESLLINREVNARSKQRSGQQFFLDGLMGIQMEKYFAVDVNSARRLFESLKQHNIDVQRLENSLNQFHVGLSQESLNEPFAALSGGGRSDQADRFFSEAYWGFFIYCILFCQHPFRDRNLLELMPPDSPWEELDTDFFNEMERFKEIRSDLLNLQKSVRDFLKRRFENLKQNEVDLTGMTEDQLRYRYYVQCIEKSNGVVKNAAKIAGIKYTTFRDKLKKLKKRLGINMPPS